MTALCAIDRDSTDERWTLVGSEGCCEFDFEFVGGKGRITWADGCHRCLNELNVFALERGFELRRTSEDER